MSVPVRQASSAKTRKGPCLGEISPSHAGPASTTHHTADAGHDVHINTSVCTRKDNAEAKGAAGFALNNTGVGNLAIAAAKGELLSVAGNPAGTCIVRAAGLCRGAGPNFTATIQGLAAAHDTWSRVGLSPMCDWRAALAPAPSFHALTMVPAA